jgi:DNA-binding NarL/FixJ family response regulator
MRAATHDAGDGRQVRIGMAAGDGGHTLLSHFGDAHASDRRRTAAQRLGALTPREREVAAVMGSGASNAEVAAALFMSEATVKAHVSRLLTKLDAVNRVQIAILVHDADPS